MANEEALTLDGLALNDGITFGMGSFDAPVPRQKQDWIGAADSEAQLLVRNPLHDNRKITVKLTVIPQASMNVAHDKLLLVLDKLQKASRYTDGIAMTWTPATGTRTATFDVLSAEIVDMPIDWENGWLAFSPTFTVEMTAKPYWRGTEVLTSTASASAPIVTLEVASVTGDVPALGRLIVTDTATQSRRHVEWGLEGPLTYNSGTSLIIDSDSLVTSGFAGTQTTLAGAYDPNASGNSVISTTLLPAPVACCGTGDLSHVGTFRVKARVYSNVGVNVRLAWRAGDGPMNANTWVPVAVETQWHELDLGTITISSVTAGTQRWTGQIEATGLGFVLVLDYLVLVPTSCGYGKARSAPTGPGTSVVTGYDNFTGTTTGGALNTRTAVLGGTWATSGDATDFVFADLPVGLETITRSAQTGTAGRVALLGSGTPTDVYAAARIYNSAPPTSSSDVLDIGVVARYVNSTNYLYATFRRTLSSTTGDLLKTLEIRQVLAGTETLLASSAALPYAVGSSRVWWTIHLVVYATGLAFAQLRTEADQLQTYTSASSSVLATAGTLASGKSGVIDRQSGSSTTITRYFDDFGVATPAPEPIVLYSGRNMQIRHDTVIRQDSTGTYTGEPPSYRGSRLTIPVGTSRVLVKANRTDVETTAAANVTDATQIQVGWTPRGLAVPR